VFGKIDSDSCRPRTFNPNVRRTEEDFIHWHEAAAPDPKTHVPATSGRQTVDESLFCAGQDRNGTIVAKESPSLGDADASESRYGQGRAGIRLPLP